MSEIKVWWQQRQKISLNRHSVIFIAVLLMFAGLLFLPWQSQISIPGVLEAGHKSDIYPAEDSKIDTIHVRVGQSVKKGALLFTLYKPELQKQKSVLERKSLYLQTRIDRHIGSAVDLDQLDILQRELAKVQTDIAGIARRIGRGEIRAPQDGYISSLINGHKGQWLSRNSALGQIVRTEENEIIAYVEESQLHRILPGASATFYSDSGDQPRTKAEVVRLSETAVATVEHPEVTSLYGGTIAVRQLEDNHLRPEIGIYQVLLLAELIPSGDIPWRIVGRVTIDTPPASPFSHFLSYAASIFIRESGM
jgi:putative peptide zinc metalloprotease protein